MHFPRLFVEQLMNRGVENNYSVIDHLNFGSKLCHECNRSVPNYGYCAKMYGGAFKQNYGWYINKQSYEYGIQSLGYSVLRDACPQEILDLIKLDPEETIAKYEQLHSTDYEAASKLINNLREQNKRIKKVIENEVRLKLGHKKIGEAWTSETILYYIVKKLFPSLCVERHYRPDFLGGLELDVYIKELKIGIEYQGIQHYKPIKHWGGEKGLIELKKRDKRKRNICKSQEISIVYFRYDEDLNDEIVKDRISEYT